MDKLARESSRPFARHAEGKNERAAELRTRVEIAASLSAFTSYLVVATSSSISTRHAALGMFLCWLLAPVSVWASTIQTTRSLLVGLERIESFLSYGASSTSRMTPIENTTSRRISFAKDKANKLRNFVGIRFGSVMFASAVAIVLLPISDQWCWIVFEVQASMNIGFFALTVFTLRRISRSRRTAKAQVHALSTTGRPS